MRFEREQIVAGVIILGGVLCVWGGVLMVLPEDKPVPVSNVGNVANASNATDTYANAARANQNSRQTRMQSESDAGRAENQRVTTQTPQPISRLDELTQREGLTHVRGDIYRNRSGGEVKVALSKDGNGLVISPVQVSGPPSSTQKPPQSVSIHPPVQGAPTPDCTGKKIRTVNGQKICY